MPKTIGYLVIERCEDYEQVLGLQRGAGLPDAGILVWETRKGPRHLFRDRKSAMAAITRTEHYRKAFASNGSPESKFCQILSVTED
jgi:hypothetical protein